MEKNNYDYEYYVDGIVLTSVSIFGLIGTMLSIRVLLRPNLRNSFSTLLAGLAACDANFLACAILIIGLPKAWEWYSRNLSVYLIPVVYGMIGVARTGSVYFTMAVTLERYFAIVRPLSQFRLKKFLLPCTVVFAVIYNIPRFFELERYVFPYTNETMVTSTSLRQHDLYTTIYLMWMKLIFLEAVPYVTIIVLNALIIRQILQSYQFRKTFRNRSGAALGTPQLNPAAATVNTGATTSAIAIAATAPPNHNSPTTSILTGRSPRIDGAAACKNGIVQETEFSSGSLKRSATNGTGTKDDSRDASPIMAIVNLGSCSQDTACRRHTAVLNVESDGSIVHSSIVNPSSNLDELEEITTIPIITTPTQNQGSVKRHFWFCKGGNEGGGASVSSSTISGVNHSAHAAERQQELSLGLTLVAISILFIVCQSVKLIPDVYELLLCEKDKTGQCSSTGFIDQLISLANLLSCINSSANFLVYMLRGKKFRDAFLVTYGCRIRRRTSTQRYLLRQQTTRTSIMGHHNITEVQQLRSNSVSEINN